MGTLLMKYFLAPICSSKILFPLHSYQGFMNERFRHIIGPLQSGNYNSVHYVTQNYHLNTICTAQTP